jgi:chromate transporter
MMLYFELLWTFLKIGALSFGGGLGMLPIIQREMAETGWMTAQEVADIVAISEMTPGPLAINAATFAGIRAGGAIGGIIATIGVTLPSVLISLLAAKYFFAVRDSRLVGAGMTGIRPAVSGMVGGTALQMIFLTTADIQLNGILDLTPQINWFSLILAVVVFTLLLKKVSPMLLILLSGIAGLVWHFLSSIIK